MRPTGRLHLGHLVGALGNWVPLQDAVRLLLFRRRLARADQRLRRHQPADDLRLRERRRLDRRRPRSGEEHVLHPVAGAGARRAVPAAVDGRAGAVARARADLQGAAGEPQGQGPVVDRVSRLSAAADRRRGDLRRAVRAGRRGSGRAPRAGARGGAALQQRSSATGAGRAAAAADDVRPPAGPRRRQEDEQEPRQHHPPRPTPPTK